MEDFPPVAWFTTQASRPNCLQKSTLFFVNDSGEVLAELDSSDELAKAIELNHIALGFRIEDIPVVHWPSHPGFKTDEGKALNESAIELGDDPSDWYVSESAVDLMKVSDVLVQKNKAKKKMERWPEYINDIKRIVQLCRSKKGVFIPPTWLSQDQAKYLANRLNLPIAK